MLGSYFMSAMWEAASYSRGGLSLCCAVSAGSVIVPGGSTFDLEPGTIIYTNREHAILFNSTPNDYIFLNINEQCVRSLLGVVQNNMELITSSAIFSTPEAIFLRDLLKPSMLPYNIQKLLVPFSDGEVKEHVKKASDYLNLFKETPQTCKGQKCKYSK